ncbi:MAG TPA: hypothetical protein VKS82_23170 [Streptosporangiaceae bacterium]|nr:hypothetical protein [Streptosporangiaceae bacterium]
MSPGIETAIAAATGDAWTAIGYPYASWDEQLRCWVPGAEAAEAGGRARSPHLAVLIVSG